MDGKNGLFQRLKPHCIAIAQAATTLKSIGGNQDDIAERLDQLKHILSLHDQLPGGTLDAKLADYVFFPLAQLLRESQKLSIRNLELILQCIAILVEQGWRHLLQSALAVQMIILCTTLAETTPKGFLFQDSTDELQASSFWCLHHVFREIGKDKESKRLLTSESTFPQLGQTITVILEGIRSSESVGPQLAGTAALMALVDHLLDVDIQASFLPGIVSALTKIISPQAMQRRKPKVLIALLTIFETLLRNTMHDELVARPNEGMQNAGGRKSVIDRAWQESAAIRLKPAIAGFLCLKTHSHAEVRGAVSSFCTMLLRDCRDTLANGTDLAIEALVFIAAGNAGDSTKDQLQHLMRQSSTVAECVRNMSYDLLQKLPTIMQGSDEEVKASKIAQLHTTYQLLINTGVNMVTLGRSMSVALRDSAVLIFGASDNQHSATPVRNPMQTLSLALRDSRGKQFSSVMTFTNQYGREKDLLSLRSIAQLMGQSANVSEFTTNLLRDLRLSSGQVQLADLWLLLNSTEASIQVSSEMDELLDLGDDGIATTNNDVIEEIYTFALAKLTEEPDEDQDPRILSLALRGLALRAKTAGEDFQYELVDALYPVLHTLATPDDQLQNESIATLDTFTTACGYSSTRDLIVENVDYLTNAVALKLNAFDVSPQAPQVLLMMVRLAGPNILPYLEDTVESIFAALEDYHGYPLLVELLFKVLSAMAEEGVKSPQLAIDQTPLKSGETNSAIRQSTTVQGLLVLLQQATLDRTEFAKASQLEAHPKKPWKDPTEALDDDENEDAELDQMVGRPDPPPLASKTYDLLFKITELTQHFLPAASPSLRMSLLSLIKTTVPALAKHENSFLPLINTLWPEIVSRLDDDEQYLVASAVEVVGLLCEYAGDFMRTRVEQVWQRLVELSSSGRGTVAYDKKVAAVSVAGNRELLRSKSNGVVDGDTTSKLISEALVSTLTKITTHVNISPEMFDDALGVLAPQLSRPDVRTALEKGNADALWLAETKLGLLEAPNIPGFDVSLGWKFVGVAS